MRTFPPPARAVAVVATLLCGAVATIAPRAVDAQAGDPCGPFGDLKELELNDRCTFGAATPDDVTVSNIATGLVESGVFATTIECRNGTEALVVASPDELIVSGSSPDGLTAGLSVLREEFGESLGRISALSGLVALVEVPPGTIDDAFLRNTIPALQGAGFSIDLNYLEPAQPNNGFRPDDDPTEAAAAPMGRGGQGRVLVVDSPSQRSAHPSAPDVVISSIGQAVIYDVGRNGYIDEDHGHGTFVASLVKRLAPRAEVVLAGVRGQTLLRSARWAPMMFSDADLINSLHNSFGLAGFGRGTKRSFDVVNLSLGGAGCDGLAARLALGRFMRDLAVAASERGPVPTYVAAAGNDGADIPHFPAAFRDVLTMKAAAEAIAIASGSAAAAEVLELNDFFIEGSIAVGSWTGGVQDAFSNCGEWVNGIAAGARSTSRFPSDSDWAIWSGTSFATPRVTAALVGGAGLTDVKVDGPTAVNAVGGC